MRVALLTWIFRAWAHLLGAVHYRALWHYFLAYFRGIGAASGWLVRYVNAATLAELKIVNPEKHRKEMALRRWTVVAPGALLALVCLTLVTGTGRIGRAFEAFHVPLYFEGLGLPGLAGIFLAQAVLFTAIGRTDALTVRVITARIATEQTIIRIANDLTLSPSQLKMGYSASIIQPPVRLRSGKGYDVVVRVHEKGKPDLLAGDPAAVAHKLTKGRSTVFTYEVRMDKSQVRILALDVDPWSQPPTVNPLVLAPRRVNLWRETISMGTAPDYSDVREQMVEEGDGGGRLAGSAPRGGKSTLLSNWLVGLMLDPTTHLHIVDGSAVDFAPCRPVCDSFIGDPNMEDRKVLDEAHKIVKKLKAECGRRKAILHRYGTNKLNEQISNENHLGTHWYINDELAAITSTLYSRHKAAVEEFLDDLVWLVSNGPKYGVFVILATQRPNEKSVPPELKDLILLRSALYIPSDSGSRAILGQSGINNRADKLDPDQKGVVISTKAGQYRTHLVGVFDLASVAQVAASLRAQHGSGTTEPDTQMVYPEPVRTMLQIMDKLQVDDIETLTLIEHLVDMDYTAVTEKKLAQSLSPWGIGPRRIYIDGIRRRGYSRVELERVPKIKIALSSPVLGTAQDTTAQDEWDGIEVAAQRDQEGDQ